MDFKARITLISSIIVLATWLSFKGQFFMPQWSMTLIYYFMIACVVYMISSKNKEQNTLRITHTKNDEGETLYEVDGESLTEKETILWIVQKMDVDEKEAKKFLKKVSKQYEGE